MKVGGISYAMENLIFLVFVGFLIKYQWEVLNYLRVFLGHGQWAFPPLEGLGPNLWEVGEYKENLDAEGGSWADLLGIEEMQLIQGGVTTIVHCGSVRFELL